MIPTLALIFAVLAGMFKALRDRDLWHGGDPTWYEAWAWYQAWSETDRYLGPFPLDAWHNFDVACMACAAIAGGLLWAGWGWWSPVAVLAVALPSKFVFYHIILMRDPLGELREYWRERIGRE